MYAAVLSDALAHVERAGVLLYLRLEEVLIIELALLECVDLCRNGLVRSPEVFVLLE